jgi:hypothetical protein
MLMKIDGTVLAVIIFSAVVIGAIIVLSVLGLSSSYSGNNMSSGPWFLNMQFPWESKTDYILSNGSISNNVDLRQVALPYAYATDMQQTCINNSGEWLWQKDIVGCKNMNLPIINCAGPAVMAASTQCEGTGGIFYCSSISVYCHLILAQ